MPLSSQTNDFCQNIPHVLFSPYFNFSIDLIKNLLTTFRTARGTPPFEIFATSTYVRVTESNSHNDAPSLHRHTLKHHTSHVFALHTLNCKLQSTTPRVTDMTIHQTLPRLSIQQHMSSPLPSTQQHTLSQVQQRGNFFTYKSFAIQVPNSTNRVKHRRPSSSI